MSEAIVPYKVKGEQLAQMVDAAGVQLPKGGVKLGCCLVVGLPVLIVI